jgi:agmatine deiminase
VRAEPVMMPRRAVESARMPAEWEPHRATWLAWPHDEEFWGAAFAAAKGELVALCRALAEGDALEMLVCDSAGRDEASRLLEGLNVRFHEVAFDDIWMRDIAPVFVRSHSGLAGVRLRFNGWGGKWEHARDSAVAPKVARAAGVSLFEVPLFLEGGALEFDGEGTCLTTRSCALNVNRNPGRIESDIEEWLDRAFGVRKTIWLERGFDCDHTDGHIDNLVRFVGPGRVVCMRAAGRNDPNAEVLEEIEAVLVTAKDSRGRALEIISVPSPGEVTDPDGELLSASYMNYCVTNTTVVVPTFRVANDAAAVEVIASCFPTRRTLGLSAKHILAGGGSFHCITQQEPLLAGEGR